MNIAVSSLAPGRKHLAMVAWFLGVGIALTLLAGVLHMPLARPWLAKLGIACPVRAGTPEQVDRARAFGAARFEGKASAPARPALGFVFEKTTLAEINAWAQKHGVTCEKIAKTDTLRSCANVPAAAIGEPDWFGPAEEVAFELRADRTLASVSTMRRRLGLGDANAITREIGSRLGADLSTAHVRGGENAPAHFAKGPLQAYKEEWTFADYGATLGEVRLGDTGMMVREHYLSAVR